MAKRVKASRPVDDEVVKTPRRKLVKVRYDGPTARLRVDGEVVRIGGCLVMDLDAANVLSGNPDIDIEILEGE